jgi:hypothetical protein
MTVTFQCGHTREATGAETELRCDCGEARITQVVAPAPRFTGHVTGPHAEFQNLPAEAVQLGETDG